MADTNPSRIQKFNSAGDWQLTVGGYGSGNGKFRYPSGVAVDGGGNLYVADTANNRIQKLDSTGAYLAQWSSVGSRRWAV